MHVCRYVCTCAGRASEPSLLFMAQRKPVFEPRISADVCAVSEAYDGRIGQVRCRSEGTMEATLAVISVMAIGLAIIALIQVSGVNARVHDLERELSGVREAEGPASVTRRVPEAMAPMPPAGPACLRCGAALPGDAQFCGECGLPVGRGAPAMAPPTGIMPPAAPPPTDTVPPVLPPALPQVSPLLM